MLDYLPYNPLLNADVLTIFNANRPYLALSKTIFDEETLLADLQQRPTNILPENKHLEVIYCQQQAVAILDYLTGYKTADSVYLGLLLVKEHGQGFGKQIVRALINRSIVAGYKEIELAVLTENRAALAFWQLLGFTIFDTVAYEKDLKVHKMQLRLSPLTSEEHFL